MSERLEATQTQRGKTEEIAGCETCCRKGWQSGHSGCYGLTARGQADYDSGQGFLVQRGRETWLIYGTAGKARS